MGLVARLRVLHVGPGFHGTRWASWQLVPQFSTATRRVVASDQHHRSAAGLLGRPGRDLADYGSVRGLHNHPDSLCPFPELYQLGRRRPDKMGRVRQLERVLLRPGLLSLLAGDIRIGGVQLAGPDPRGHGPWHIRRRDAALPRRLCCHLPSASSAVHSRPEPHVGGRPFPSVRRVGLARHPRPHALPQPGLAGQHPTWRFTRSS